MLRIQVQRIKLFYRKTILRVAVKVLLLRALNDVTASATVVKVIA